MRWQRKKEPEGGTDWGGEREVSACISSPVLSGSRGKRERARGRILGRGCAGVAPPDLDQSPLVFFFPGLLVFALLCLLSLTRVMTSSLPPPHLHFCFSFHWSLSFFVSFCFIAVITPLPRYSYSLPVSGTLAQVFKRSHRNISDAAPTYRLCLFAVPVFCHTCLILGHFTCIF